MTDQPLCIYCDQTNYGDGNGTGMGWGDAVDLMATGIKFCGEGKQELETIKGPIFLSETQSARVPMEYGLKKDVKAPFY